LEDYRMKKWKTRGIYSVMAVLVSSLACRPVITVGWGEMLILIVILLLVLGVPLLRVWRAKSRDDDRDSSSEQG
jgi:hypothetical protein